MKKIVTLPFVAGVLTLPLIVAILRSLYGKAGIEQIIISFGLAIFFGLALIFSCLGLMKSSMKSCESDNLMNGSLSKFFFLAFYTSSFYGYLQILLSGDISEALFSAFSGGVVFAGFGILYYILRGMYLVIRTAHRDITSH